MPKSYVLAQNSHFTIFRPLFGPFLALFLGLKPPQKKNSIDNTPQMISVTQKNGNGDILCILVALKTNLSSK